jgi:hypothetical protein
LNTDIARGEFSVSSINRYAFCPRWFEIDYVLGFRPKSPIKSKFPVGDAIHRVLFKKDIAHFQERVNNLIATEKIFDEDVEFGELVERGLMLAQAALDWLCRCEQIVWQEQLVQFKIDSFTFFGYPDLVAIRNGKRLLYDYKTSYVPYQVSVLSPDVVQFVIYKLGFEVAQEYKLDEAKVLSLVYRTRKERNSPRAKTPIFEINEVPVVINDEIIEAVRSTIVQVARACQAGLFPRLGIRNDTCSWCPNGQVLKDRPFCLYPNDVLKQFAETSLQRCSSERWRDEF